MRTLTRRDALCVSPAMHVLGGQRGCPLTNFLFLWRVLCAGFYPLMHSILYIILQVGCRGLSCLLVRLVNCACGPCVQQGGA